MINVYSLFWTCISRFNIFKHSPVSMYFLEVRKKKVLNFYFFFFFFILRCAKHWKIFYTTFSCTLPSIVKWKYFSANVLHVKYFTFANILHWNKQNKALVSFFGTWIDSEAPYSRLFGIGETCNSNNEP